ncbi:hypothetical protein [Burkholderia seminalis]|uniref:hypothetical protein n=1 Tax=Burkholderia seminalis TaxID=488731 RepID=UPI0015831CF4|nr:hypothetical protein [Burkholderia seminalis]MCA8306772.1 hypothetical protein [Burkholderia seminalis]MCA8435258.1 hypothetical protein [Burkholderia seminalis]
MDSKAVVFILAVTAMTAGGTIYWQRHTARHVGELPAPRSETAPHVASPPDSSSDSSSSGGLNVNVVAPLPSFRASDALAAASAARAASSPKRELTPTERRSRAMNDAISQFEGMTEAQRRDPVAVAKAVEKLEVANGSTILGSTDLEVLKHNLIVVSKIQELSSQLQGMQSATASVPSSEVEASLAKKRAELMNLSSELRPDAVVQKKPIGESKSE